MSAEDDRQNVKPAASRAPWLRGVYSNPEPCYPVGTIMFAKGGVLGTVLGYKENDAGTKLGYLVHCINSNHLRLVFQEEIIEAQWPATRRPKLRIVK